MAQRQEIEYRKPEFIEKSQADLIKAIEDYIVQVKAEGLPEREAVGLSDTQKEAIELLKKGIGAFDPTVSKALSALDTGIDKATATRPDFLKTGTAALEDALATKFDVSMADPFINQYNKFVIDEINKQAALSGKKIDDAATKVGAFGGDREAVAKSLLEEARLSAIGKSSKDIFDQALKTGLGVFGQEESEKLKSAQLAPYFTSAGSKADVDAAKTLLAGAQVGGGLANLASKLGMSDIQALLGAGTLEQKVAQDFANINFTNQLAAQQQPLQLFGFLSDAIAGLPSNQGTQIQTTYGSTTSPLQDIIGTGATILGGSNIFGSKDGGSMMEKGIMSLNHGRS
tara:strand:+ start:612 stop:1640 length:1029 start_codon:yes stop_codon:yes gene_type:complete